MRFVIEGELVEPSPRLLATDPWSSVDQYMDRLIDKVIIEMNPETQTEEQLKSLLEDTDNRQNAIDWIISKLVKITIP
jgi:hypothetical protein